MWEKVLGVQKKCDPITGWVPMHLPSCNAWSVCAVSGDKHKFKLLKLTFKHLHFYFIFVVGSEGTWSGRLAPGGSESALPKYLETRKSKTQGKKLLLGCLGETGVGFPHCQIHGLRKIPAAHVDEGCPQNIHSPHCLKWSSKGVLWVEGMVSHSTEGQPSSSPGEKANGHLSIHLNISVSSVLKSGWHPPFIHCRKRFKASTKPRTEAFSWLSFNSNENKIFLFELKTSPAIRICHASSWRAEWWWRPPFYSDVHSCSAWTFAGFPTEYWWMNSLQPFLLWYVALPVCREVKMSQTDLKNMQTTFGFSVLWGSYSYLPKLPHQMSF